MKLGNYVRTCLLLDESAFHSNIITQIEIKYIDSLRSLLQLYYY